jgi:hypothetical protein
MLKIQDATMNFLGTMVTGYPEFVLPCPNLILLIRSELSFAIHTSFQEYNPYK